MFHRKSVLSLLQALTLLLSPVLYSIFNGRREKRYDDPESLTNQLREYDMRRLKSLDDIVG